MKKIRTPLAVTSLIVLLCAGLIAAHYHHNFAMYATRRQELERICKMKLEAEKTRIIKDKGES